MHGVGILKTWSDDRGYGFIETTWGGERIFVHRQDFTNLTGRPKLGQRFTFVKVQNPSGGWKAVQVELNERISWHRWILAAVINFLAFTYLRISHCSHPSWFLFRLELSIITLMVYACDKYAGEKRLPSRVPENVLLVLSFMGGGAGAYIGQEVLKHKTSYRKARFRSNFYVCVIANLIFSLIPVFRPQIQRMENLFLEKMDFVIGGLYLC